MDQRGERENTEGHNEQLKDQDRKFLKARLGKCILGRKGLIFLFNSDPFDRYLHTRYIRT